ncbi:MAG: hypothetical protein KDC98_19930 [Planctomycetes bacterium]|nr:hypothetical protein [Planctomycetota bacterium]
MGTTEKEGGKYTRRDAWLGVPFLVTGALMVIYAILAGRNGVPIVLWWAAVWLGPLFVLLGANAVVRSLWVRK